MATLDLVIRGAQIATTSQSTVADVGIAAGRVDGSSIYDYLVPEVFLRAWIAATLM